MIIIFDYYHYKNKNYILIFQILIIFTINFNYSLLKEYERI